MTKPLVDWISVKDRLPPVLENVLVFLAFKEPRNHRARKTTYHIFDTAIDTGTRFGKKGPSRWAITDKSAKDYDKNCIEVTHWMPLPEPPQGEKS